MIKFDLLKDAKKSALTLSYDDGSVFDRKLIGILNKYGIKSSFHLTSGWLDDGKHINSSEIRELYKNHEVSCHGLYHSVLNFLPQSDVISEIMNDKKALETACGYPIRGMSYAYGSYNADVIDIIKRCGIGYARTVDSTKSFGFPKDYMQWHPTCHHELCIEYANKFIKGIEGYFSGPNLFYVWGHSYEFERNNNWNLIEEFCEIIGGRDDIWYATNVEIYEYIMAQKSLAISADSKIIYNPTATEVWFTEIESGKAYSVKGGESIILD